MTAVALSNIKPRIGTLGPVVKRRTDAHGHAPTEARRWYKTAAWQVLRVRVFERDGYICQWPGCGILCVPDDPVTPPIADHKIPHRGDRNLFFDEENVWTLCKPDHDSAKQAEEAADRQRGG